MRKRTFFYDGNKRLATLMTNKVMIENGIGEFSIPIKFHADFYKMLVRFYETGEKTELKRFMYDNCIDGLNLEQKETMPESKTPRPPKRRR